MLPYVDFPTLGWQIADWMEAMLCHGPGDVAGEHWDLDDEFRLFLAWTYRLHPEGHALAGRRLVHRAILSRPKGRAKSEFAGGWVCAEALGPVRFDHWAEDGEISDWGYEYEVGEPVGCPVRSPFIRCLATEEDQSGNTYDNVEYMLKEGEVAKHFNLDVGLTRTFIKENGGGEIRPSTSGDASKDGGKESAAVADETHLYVLPKLKKMHQTVARNTGKRKIAEPLMLETTTAWEPGERSVAELAAGKYAATPPELAVTRTGILYDHRQGPEPKRFNDDRSLKKALKDGYGEAASWMDLDLIVKLIRDAEDPEGDAYRYWLNRPRKAAAAWLGPDEVKAMVTGAEMVLGEAIGLGFDGSETDDHTVLWAANRDRLLVPIGIWTPGDDEDPTWREDVDSTVDWAFENFAVKLMYGDPAWWQDYMARWAARHGMQRVAEFWTGGRSERKFATACGALRTQIRKGTVKVNPEPLQTVAQERDGKALALWHFENARQRKVRVKSEDEEREDAYTVAKDRPGSSKKIDSVPGGALALKAIDDAERKGLLDEPEYQTAQW